MLVKRDVSFERRNGAILADRRVENGLKRNTREINVPLLLPFPGTEQGDSNGRDEDPLPPQEAGPN